MANRILGIIGPGRGPWIFTSSLVSPRAKVIGLKNGIVRVFSSHSLEADAEELCTEIGVCGRHEIHAAPYMRVEYDGPDLIVCTLHGSAVATS